MKIVIRKMIFSDISEVCDILSQCYHFLADVNKYSNIQLQRLLDERCTKDYVFFMQNTLDCFIASLDSRIVGFLALAENKVEELFVIPEHHRCGVGKHLFEFAEYQIFNSGFHKLTIVTTGYAVGFYKAMNADVVKKQICSSGPLKGWEQTFLEKIL